MRRKSEYRAWKKKINEPVAKNKVRVDEEFGRKLSEFMDNNNSSKKKIFWKDIKKERGEVGGVSLIMMECLLSGRMR